MKAITVFIAPFALAACGMVGDSGTSFTGPADMTDAERAEARRLVDGSVIDIDPDAVGNAFSAYIAWKIDRGEAPGIDWSEEKLADFKFQCALAGILADGVRFSDYPDVTGADVNAACDKAVRLLIRPDG